MNKTRINLDIFLPEVPNERDECVRRIIKSLEHKRGIDKVHVVPEDGNNKAQLCFHYDPSVISISKVEQLAKAGGIIKLGLEGYFTGKQYLNNGTQTPAFKELGFMAEKIFKKFSLFINFENFTDTRQSRYKNVVNGSHLNPVFDDIWTHTEGFVINGGVKLKL